MVYEFVPVTSHYYFFRIVRNFLMLGMFSYLVTTDASDFAKYVVDDLGP